MLTSAEAIGQILGGRKVLGRTIHSISDLNAVVAKGLPKKSLDALVTTLVSDTPVNETSVRYSIVPRATYSRVERLSPELSARTERLARVYAIVLEALEDAQEAREFMMQLHPELGDLSPLEVARTELGARMVEEVIARAEYGLPA